MIPTILLALLLALVGLGTGLQDCSNYNGQDACQGSQNGFPDSDEARRWQTPPRGHPRWSPGYQDMSDLAGYAHVTYSGDRRSATVEVRAFTKASDATLRYSFNGVEQSSATFSATDALTDDLYISVTASSAGTSWRLELEPVNFVWQNEGVDAPNTEGGQKGGIVELFGWPWRDIELECVDFLGPAGYLGVKVFPPNESVLSNSWTEKGGMINPWYFIYQPVSYKLNSRMGTRAELRRMIQACRRAGVRVYADSVVNHMSGNGNDVNPEHRTGAGGGYCARWGPKEGTGGSPFFTHGYQFAPNPFTGERPALEFPSVPYGPTDFHCERTLGSWSDPGALNYGWLVGLTDLDTSKPYVRQRIAQYWVDLLGVGFSGFRVDAAKHIQPEDLAAIYGLFNEYMGGSLPGDFLSWLEVIMGGEAGLLACEEGPYNYYASLDAKLRAAGISETDLQKLKVWSSDYPKEHPICGRWILPASRFVIQNDDHDQQNPGSSSRDMQGRGSVLIKDKNVDLHRGFEVQLFSRRDADWKIRLVLSSYTFMENGANGFPDGLSDCSRFEPPPGFPDAQGCTQSMPYEPAFRQGAPGYTVEGFRGGVYTRVHRDLAIVNAMRDWIGLGPLDLSTTSPPLPAPGPTPAPVTAAPTTPVPSAAPTTPAPSTSPTTSAPSTAPSTSAPTVEGEMQRTVIFIEAQTQVGQDLFVRGGMDFGFAKERFGAECSIEDLGGSICAVPLVHRNLLNPTTRAWKTGDNYLDWSAREPGQGGEDPQGTPLDWTTNDAGYAKTVAADGYGYHPLNVYGEGYWMLDVDLDCSKLLDQRWFELKSFLARGDGWESDVSQDGAPYESGNHFAECGRVNVFRRGDPVVRLGPQLVAGGGLPDQPVANGTPAVAAVAGGAAAFVAAAAIVAVVVVRRKRNSQVGNNGLGEGTVNPKADV